MIRNNIGFQIPSPWIARFESEADCTAALARTPNLLESYDYIDDELVASRHPRCFLGFCAICHSVQMMRIDWYLVDKSGGGSIHPAWTETSVCERCGNNSRMRAMVDFLLRHSRYNPNDRCYLAERVTISYPIFAQHFSNLETSEYLGPDRNPGEMVYFSKQDISVRHEDLTRLSFGDSSFDWVITQDVFEHIPDYHAAFRECNRVLNPGGHLVFSIPFGFSLSLTEVRARIKEDGSIEHLLPPEIHGDPLEGKGVLCYQRFGWDILDHLRLAGFSKTNANVYWGPWMGHLGARCSFVFSAHK
jgi:SAM-dependent methyltransferase